MTSRRAPVLSRLLREEEGGFLIEILVSSVILLTVALGVVAAFDTAGAQSGQQRSQAVASNLAVAELERLRSLKFEQLRSQNGARPPQRVGGTVFTVTSQIAETGTPPPGGGGCDNAALGADSLRVSATVTWPTQNGQRPVRLTSIIAAPASANSTRGAVVVQVVNREGFGVAGLAISMSGASSATATTDDNGCARFTDLIAANGYRLRFQRAGWLDTLGREAIDDPVDVIAGTTQTKSYQYDNTGTVNASFFYKRAGSATNVAAPQQGVTWSHTILPGGTTTQPISPAAATVTSVPLTVSATPYGVYADPCPSAAPPVANQGTVTSPGGSVAVQVPALVVRVTYGGSGLAGASVYATTACGTRIQLPGVTDATGQIVGGVPYANGTMTVCVEGMIYGTLYHYSESGKSATNYGTFGTTGNGADNLVTYAPTTAPTGPCP